MRLTRRFDASPERVFDAWTLPALASRWLFTSPESESNRTEMDARPGGVYEIIDRRDSVDYRAVGEYQEVIRPSRLAFTFAMPQFSPDADRLVVDIEPRAGGTAMTLAHEKLPPEYQDATRAGWEAMFDVLAAVLDGPAETNQDGDSQ